MTELLNHSFCCFCKHEFRDGEGRYRLFQQEEEVDSCPSCFDEMRTVFTNPFGEPAEKQPTYKTEKEF